MPPITDGSGLIFAGGAPRSGLTLLRCVLNAHPEIFCGPDSGVMPSLALQWGHIATNLGELHEKHFALDREDVKEIFARAIWRLLAETASHRRQPVTVEKSPLNIVAFETIAALMPKAKFIHVVRDGRDVVASLLERNWRDPQTGAPFPHVTDPSAAAAYWGGLTELGWRAARAIDDPRRFFVLEYEALAKSPDATMKKLFDFIEVGDADVVTNFHRNSIPLLDLELESEAELRQPIGDRRVGRWRRDLTAPQCDAVKANASAMLKAFRYLPQN